MTAPRIDVVRDLRGLSFREALGVAAGPVTPGTGGVLTPPGVAGVTLPIPLPLIANSAGTLTRLPAFGSAPVRYEPGLRRTIDGRGVAAIGVEVWNEPGHLGATGARLVLVGRPRGGTAWKGMDGVTDLTTAGPAVALDVAELQRSPLVPLPLSLRNGLVDLELMTRGGNGTTRPWIGDCAAFFTDAPDVATCVLVAADDFEYSGATFASRWTVSGTLGGSIGLTGSAASGTASLGVSGPFTGGAASGDTKATHTFTASEGLTANSDVLVRCYIALTLAISASGPPDVVPIGLRVTGATGTTSDLFDASPDPHVPTTRPTYPGAPTFYRFEAPGRVRSDGTLDVAVGLFGVSHVTGSYQRQWAIDRIEICAG